MFVSLSASLIAFGVAILLLGLVRRQTYGIGRIGFESALILGVYIIALCVVVAGN